MPTINRRQFIHSVAGFTAMSCLPNAGAGQSQPDIPIRAITRGPKPHWFGYYDKWQFDPTDRYVLGMELPFEGRTPGPEDIITIGMVDLENKDKWIELGESRSWGWQQGCMLQWVPNTDNKIIWNDREGDRFVSRTLDIRTGKKETLPAPVYALSQDGRWAIGADFARIQAMRPGYGYKGVTDPYHDQLAPEKSGIYKMDLLTGETKLIVTLAQLAEIPYQGKPTTDKWNYVNHLLVSPDSERFIFLHRWRANSEGHASGGFTTRMFTADKNGEDLYILDPSGKTSHFIWRDPKHVAMWTRPVGKHSGFWLMKDKTTRMEQIGKGVMTVNGHNTYLPHTENQWILNDTYPRGEAREQIPYVYHIPTNRKIELGRFHLPPAYKGEWRCDTHPRFSRSGRRVCIDSPHGGNGRQLYLIDIEDVIEG